MTDGTVVRFIDDVTLPDGRYDIWVDDEGELYASEFCEDNTVKLDEQKSQVVRDRLDNVRPA